MHIEDWKKFNMDKYHHECDIARRDFDKIFADPHSTMADAMIEKYFLFIQANFDPYMPMDISRQHSNLWGKY